MEIGILAPKKLLNKYCLTKIQYVYPRFFDQDEDYAVFHLQKRWEEESPITIVDCSKPGWKREPENLNLCLRAVDELRPHYIVLPSYTYDFERTVEIGDTYLETIASDTEAGLENFVPCLEGVKREDIIGNYLEIQNKIVAIPQTCSNSGMADFARSNTRKRKVHIYLDHYTKLSDIEPRDRDILITSLPIRQGLLGRLLTDPTPPPLILDYKAEEDKYPDIVKYNLRELVNYYGI